jgi:hypothetical protein
MFDSCRSMSHAEDFLAFVPLSYSGPRRSFLACLDFLRLLSFFFRLFAMQYIVLLFNIPS